MNSRAADTDGRQTVRERREVERKRRSVCLLCGVRLNQYYIGSFYFFDLSFTESITES